MEVAKVYQKEHEHIRVYASTFGELHCFFRSTLTEEAVIGLFLNNVRKSLKVHAVGIKRSKPSWDAFLCEITKLDNEEPRDISVIKGNVRKPVLAVEVERNGSSPRERELELLGEIEMLKKRIREIEVPFEERKTSRSGYARNQRDQVKCFSCGRLGHIARNCFNKQSRSNVAGKTKKEKEFKNEFLGKGSRD